MTRAVTLTGVLYSYNKAHTSDQIIPRPRTRVPHRIPHGLTTTSLVHGPPHAHTACCLRVTRNRFDTVYCSPPHTAHDTRAESHDSQTSGSSAHPAVDLGQTRCTYSARSYSTYSTYSRVTGVARRVGFRLLRDCVWAERFASRDGPTASKDSSCPN